MSVEPANWRVECVYYMGVNISVESLLSLRLERPVSWMSGVGARYPRGHKSRPNTAETGGFTGQLL